MTNRGFFSPRSRTTCNKWILMMMIHCTYPRAFHLAPLQPSQWNARHELPKCTLQGCWQLTEQGKSSKKLAWSTIVQVHTHGTSIVFLLISIYTDNQIWHTILAISLHSVTGFMQFPQGLEELNSYFSFPLTIIHGSLCSSSSSWSSWSLLVWLMSSDALSFYLVLIADPHIDHLGVGSIRSFTRPPNTNDAPMSVLGR